MQRLKVFLGICLVIIGVFFCLRVKTNVSVIVPVYNSEKYLEKCLDSLQKQTLKNMEFIVIDDGSKDKSFEIMKKYRKKDKRFKIYSKQNEGVGITRNMGLKVAKGEYIGFVDSDDYVSKNYFEELYKTAKKYDAEVSVSSNVVEFDGVSYQKKWRAIYKYRNKMFFDDFSFLIMDAGEQWDKIYKKSFLDEYNIKCYDKRLWFEDIWFSTLVAVYAKSVAVSKEGSYFYRVREGSLSEFWDVSEQYLLHGLDMYKEIFKHINTFNLSVNKRHDLMIKLHDKIYGFISIFHDAYNKNEAVKNRVAQYFVEFENLIHNKGDILYN